MHLGFNLSNSKVDEHGLAPVREGPRDPKLGKSSQLKIRLFSVSGER